MAARAGLQRIRIQNYRVLRDITFDDLTPLTVLFGPNGSGKSTVFDVFAFLHEAFSTNLRRAWDARNRISEIRSRGAEGPVEFELQYRATEDSPLITYGLKIDERAGQPVITDEVLRHNSSPGPERPTEILHFSNGSGRIHDEQAGSVSEQLESADLLAVSSLGQLSRHPHVAALRRFITGWYLSYLNIDQSRSQAFAGPQEKLSATGDNLANVLQYLSENHDDRLEGIFNVLRESIPSLERIDSEKMPDGRLLLRLKDRPFDDPVLAQFTSDGTLKLLAYLTVLYDPTPAPVLGIEEPENQLHPRLLYPLAEQARRAADRSQMLVTTHSPYFADALAPKELWVLYRGDDGFTRTKRASEIDRVSQMNEAGGSLGDLWMEGYFGVGDPFAGTGVDR